jgi:hypothetical protein
MRMAGASERSGWFGLSRLLRRLLRLMVAPSYEPSPLPEQEDWMKPLHRAFLTLYSSDAHYPRPAEPTEDPG